MNWYLCEVTRAGGPLPMGVTKGKKVYCRRKAHDDPRVLVIDLVNNFSITSRRSAQKHLRIIRRLSDRQSQGVDRAYNA